MSTLDHNEPDDQKVLGSHGPSEIDASAGYEQTDVKVTGILVFLVSLAIFVAVCGVVTYGMGKLINAHMNKEDGPNNKWTKTAEIRQLGNLPSSPEMQNKVAEITGLSQLLAFRPMTATRTLPICTSAKTCCSITTPGSTSRRAKSEFLSSAPCRSSRNKVCPLRRPCNRRRFSQAISKPTVTAPLTSGFARTGYEQDQAAAQEEEAEAQQATSNRIESR